MNTETLVAEVDPVELMSLAPELVIWRRGVVDTPDDLAQFMVKGGPVSPRMSAVAPHGEDSRPDKSYWEAVKTEMGLFLCTDDKRYRVLWNKLNAIEKKSSATIVGVIAAFLGASIGAPAALLSGFIAVCLYGITKLGKEAYCRYIGQTEA